MSARVTTDLRLRSPNLLEEVDYTVQAASQGVEGFYAGFCLAPKVVLPFHYSQCGP